MKVWRVENNKHYGSYQCSYPGNFTSFCGDESISRHNDMEHPTPYEDGIKESRGKVCCFSSEEQLHDWFTYGELTLLKEHGFHVSVYEVEESIVVRGRKQAMIPLSIVKELG